ncbi:MAG: hypothetical protein JWN88_78 [Frankiales bacterium]|nr:hypothetical protein [Frankiales bacterium]
MTGTRALRVLLCAAVLGLLLAIGLIVEAVGGLVATTVYAACALAVLVVAVARGRRLLAPPALPPGRTCQCCTTSQHDPVKVI